MPIVIIRIGVYVFVQGVQMPSMFKYPPYLYTAREQTTHVFVCADGSAYCVLVLCNDRPACTHTNTFTHAPTTIHTH